MKSVGLDLSITGTGIAIINNGKKIYSTVIKSKPAGDRPIDELKRVRNIVDTIEESVRRHLPGSPDIVVIENLAFMAQGNTLTKLSGLNYLVRDMCYKNGWPFALIAPLTLKKFVTGIGKGDKDAMIAGIRERWGEVFLDDNEADAYALAQSGQSLLSKETNPSVSTKHVIQLISSQIT